MSLLIAVFLRSLIMSFYCYYQLNIAKTEWNSKKGQYDYNINYYANQKKEAENTSNRGYNFKSHGLSNVINMEMEKKSKEEAKYKNLIASKQIPFYVSIAIMITSIICLVFIYIKLCKNNSKNKSNYERKVTLTVNSIPKQDSKNIQEKLALLKNLYDNGLIQEKEYNEKRNEIIKNI